MNILSTLQQHFQSCIQKHFTVSKKLLHTCTLSLNTDDKRQAFGDLTSNAPLLLAQEVHQPPRTIALALKQAFSHPAVANIDVAGPGFINIFLTLPAWQEVARTLFLHPDTYFKLEPHEPKHNFSIEFISANPTGPLHFGHGRGGIIGDVHSAILSFLGHRVTKEFYINDAGNQIEKLGESFQERCKQVIGHPYAIPEEGYHGTYLLDMAHEFMMHHDATILQQPISFFASYAKNKLLELIKQTLTDYGITFDVWFSEKTLHESGAIENAVSLLKKKGYCYEKENALWFKSTAFSDDKDRVIKKSTGQWTYAAADIAYLVNKVERRYDRLMMILGHDHHSFAIRLKGFAQALEINPDMLTIILYQLVTMKEDGQVVQMSKRAGTMVTLADVIQTVGKDVARFFYIHRKVDAQLEFDLELALKKNEENPVYYIQYAYVRTRSILEKAAQQLDAVPACDTDAFHIGATEVPLLKKMISLRELLITISHNQQPHLLSYYAIELADCFHKYYAAHRVIDPQAPNVTKGRLLLITLLKHNFELVLTLLGLSRPEKM
jgi:arginyl-tRNA synthetase